MLTSSSYNTSRRLFIQQSAGLMAVALLPVRLVNACELPHQYYSTQDLKLLSHAALEAAKGKGAEYADVFFRNTRRESWESMIPHEQFIVGVGVRALFNGSWGFAGTDGFITLDDAAQLGREAATQASYGAPGKAPAMGLAQSPVVADGRWVMSVQTDPFTVASGEKIDFMMGVRDYIKGLRVGTNAGMRLYFTKDERTFASTEGSFTSQVSYTTSGTLNVHTEAYFATDKGGVSQADFLTPAGKGWEYIRKAPFKEEADRLIEEADRTRLHAKPIDVGRYDIVFDAYAIANILDQTVGVATELDRALGYEANTLGTSFLNEPLEMLGSFKMGSPLVNVTANRSESGGAATVKWDDEGVESGEITLVKEGILTDFQTTRESVGWLAPYYDRVGKVVKSSGNSSRDMANVPPGQCPSNFVLLPGSQTVTFEDMILDTKRGLAVVGGRTRTDPQALNGNGTGTLVYEIRDGRLTDMVEGANYLYRTPEFWRNVVAIGGPDSSRRFGFNRSRNAKNDYAAHSVTAVPAKVVQVAVTDVMRKS